jgi:hypothetical protein
LNFAATPRRLGKVRKEKAPNSRSGLQSKSKTVGGAKVALSLGPELRAIYRAIVDLIRFFAEEHYLSPEAPAPPSV